ncbi:MAG: hypothetical protein CEE43_09135 [Promethearchaeota archaeon Loki_b32]|nr:MAG: hypothetical protein CEE43_09135 [Candidatus Lokiarchaeota archaeon Loki_b32]
MERGNKEKIIEMIKAIENKNSEMEEYISNLSILSRNDMLKKITQDIINNNSLLQELLGTEMYIISSEETEKNSSSYIIEGYINKIQKDPYKKIIFLREFLGLFQERISEMDKEVILKSLKDEKNEEKLREEMISLANTFNLNS